MKNRFQTRPILWEIMLVIQNENMSKLSKESNVTFSHLSKIINELEKLKIVTSHMGKSRRERIITLTLKGTKILKKMVEINKLLNEE